MYLFAFYRSLCALLRSASNTVKFLYFNGGVIVQFGRCNLTKQIYVLLSLLVWVWTGAEGNGGLDPNPTAALSPGQKQGQQSSNGINKSSSQGDHVRACPLGHFGCTISPSLCIPQSAICNGKPDCPDAEDEGTRCHNIHEKFFWDTYFQKRPDADVDRNSSCKYDLSSETLLSQTHWANHTGLETGTGIVQPGGQASGRRVGPGPGCHCSAEKLFCQNIQHLSNLILMMPWEVEFLDLSGSKVDVKDFTTREFPRMHTLILSSCSIQDISAGAFSRLHNLRTLHLTNNQLQTIPNDAFSGNSNLQKLFLGYNQLVQLLPNSFHGLASLQELDLRHNKLVGSERNIYSLLKTLRILQMSGNQLDSEIQNYFAGLDNLEILNLGSNSIQKLEKNTFQDLISLRQLYLSWNKIQTLENGTFCNLTSLVSLNLNGNQITRIHSEAFACLENLESLNLERNRFGELDHPRLIFGNLTNLQHIYFDQFWMCWWAPHVPACEPKGDGISSVENLLDNLLLRTCVWIMGLMGVLGNLFVIVSRVIFREKNRVHSFYIKNLGLADGLMGLFLLCIAIHDLKFRGEFLARQEAWRHSFTCQFAGMLSTLSSEASVLILTLITLDRYLSIIRPFAERSNALRPALAIISVLWFLSIVLSGLPFMDFARGYFGMEFYRSNGLCLPLQIHNPYDSGWEYSFLLFVILNSLAFGFICYAYWRMLRIIQSSSTTLRTNQQRQDGVLAMRFGLVVVTDFVCWAPVIIAKTLAMCGIAIPTTFYAWLAVFVLPVNSSLNPILYTLTTKLFKQRLSKMTLGFRKRLRLDDSSASLSFFYRATHRTTTTSMGNSVASIRQRSLSKSGELASTRKFCNSIPLSQISGNPTPPSFGGCSSSAGRSMPTTSIAATATVHTVSRIQRTNSIRNGVCDKDSVID